MDQSGFVKFVDISKHWAPYIETTLARLRYLLRDIEFTFNDGVVWIRPSNTVNLEELRTEFFHALYREKILHETAGMRRTLYSQLFGQ